MEQKTRSFIRTVPLENNDLEQRLEKKIKNVNTFGNSIKKTKYLIIYFRDKTHISKNN